MSQLTKAWEFDTAVKGRKWQNTPVVIDGLMCITLQNGGVVALEPETGRELWRYEAQVRGRSVRAVSFWPGDGEAGPRLLYGAGDWLIALDPKTGVPVRDFGENGVVNVHPGTPDAAKQRAAQRSAAGPPPGAGRPTEEGGPPRGGFGGGPGFSLSSPPAIYRNLVIVGGSLSEGAVVGPPGDPQAFDVRTGKLVWRFNVVPRPGEKNGGTWGDGWKDRGGPAIWGLDHGGREARPGVPAHRESGRQLLWRRPAR